MKNFSGYFLCIVLFKLFLLFSFYSSETSSTTSSQQQQAPVLVLSFTDVPRRVFRWLSSGECRLRGQIWRFEKTDVVEDGDINELNKVFSLDLVVATQEQMAWGTVYPGDHGYRQLAAIFAEIDDPQCCFGYRAELFVADINDPSQMKDGSPLYIEDVNGRDLDYKENTPTGPTLSLEIDLSFNYDSN